MVAFVTRGSEVRDGDLAEFADGPAEVSSGPDSLGGFAVWEPLPSGGGHWPKRANVYSPPNLLASTCSAPSPQRVALASIRSCLGWSMDASGLHHREFPDSS